MKKPHEEATSSMSEPFVNIYETPDGNVFCVESFCQFFGVDYLAERDRILESDLTVFGNAAARIFLLYSNYVEYVLSIPLDHLTREGMASLGEYQDSLKLKNA